MKKIYNKFSVLILLIGIFMIVSIFFIKYKIDEESEVQIKDLTIFSEKGVYDIEAENQSNFIVILSNQSYENTKVNLTVLIDGNELISQDCKTENQHTGYYYYYNLEGTHIIKVVSEDGQEVQKTVSLDENIPLWVLVSYWSDGERAKIELNIMDSPFLWE